MPKMLIGPGNSRVPYYTNVWGGNALIQRLFKLCHSFGGRGEHPHPSNILVPMQRNSPPNHAILAAAATDAEVDDVEDTPFRVKRVDTLKMCFLLVAPLFFLFSHWIPFRGSPPSLQDLQQTLQDLDEECYKQSGCLELPGVLARCEKQRASCPDAYYYELRQLNRNCRALRLVLLHTAPSAAWPATHNRSIPTSMPFIPPHTPHCTRLVYNTQHPEAGGLPSTGALWQVYL